MLKLFFQEPDVILILIPLSEIFLFFLSLYVVILGVLKFCNDDPELTLLSLFGDMCLLGHRIFLVKFS